MNNLDMILSGIDKRKFTDENGKYPSDELDQEIFVSNYIFMTQKMIKDIEEIDCRLEELKRLDHSCSASKECEHKKLRYFSEINKEAKNEIITFAVNGLKKFLIENKNIKFVDRCDDELLNLRINCCYQYGFLKRYYDQDYDFSTEAKIRFAPGISAANYLEEIKDFIELKKDYPEEYKLKINTIIEKNDLLNELISKVEKHNLLNRRKEIFETLKLLYDTEKWESFINLGILQIEGLFFDCCNALEIKDLSKARGSLTEKVERSLKDNNIIKLAVFPYYQYDVPDKRNEVAHTGFYNVDRYDMREIANELILDMNTIISWIYRNTHEKYKILENIAEKIVNEQEENEIMTLVFEMLGWTVIADYKYLDVLKNPDNFSEEIKCMGEESYWNSIIMNIQKIIKTEEFWNYIDNSISETELYDENKIGSLLTLANKLTNTFISILKKDSPEKNACQKVSAKIKKCKENQVLLER